MGALPISLPLSHPSSVSTGLRHFETNTTKLCSVRKGRADAMKKQMLQSKMVFLACRASSRLLTETTQAPREALLLPAPNTPSPAAPGTPASFSSLRRPEATGPRNRTSFLRSGSHGSFPAPRGLGCSARRGGPRALRKVHRGGRPAGGRARAAPARLARVPQQIPPLISPEDCLLAT